MNELRHSLHALVEHPPARPAGVEVVAARAARITRRRRAFQGAAGLALMAIVSGAGLRLAGQGAEPGMRVATDGPRTAGYIAEQPGGYLATGTWSLTITRRGQVIELTSASSDDCGPIGVIQPGDEVRGTIAGRGSELRVGEKFSCPR